MDCPGAAVPPIIADENGDVTLFQSVNDAEHYVEAIDVRNGAYVFFDSVGAPLKAVAERDVVRITRDESSGPQPDALTERLRGFVARVGPERIGLEEPDAAPLPVLVAALTRFSGLT